ncbi:MAG: helix-turn-helix domain-containing protein [Pseudomonadota bacterium]
MEYLCLQDKTLLEVEDLPSWIKNADSTLENALGLNNGLLDLRKVSTNYHLALGNFEKEYLRIALERRHGMVNQTAKELGLSKSTLIAKARKYGINVWLIKAGQQSRTGATLSLSA